MGHAPAALSLRCPADHRHASFKGTQRACFESSVDLDPSGAVLARVRPVIIVSRRIRNRQTCVVVPASTVAPIGRRGSAVELSASKYSFLNRSTWAKCEMVTTVSLRRLFFFRDLSTGRNLDSRRTTIEAGDLAEIRRRAAVAVGLALT